MSENELRTMLFNRFGKLLLSQDEVADILGMNKKTLRNALNKGVIKLPKVDGTTKYKLDEVAKAISTL